MKTFASLRSRRLLVIAALAALLLLLVAPARAAETRGGENILIGPNEVINGDLYAAGNTVTVDGTINGDLVAVGNLITVNGMITGDLLAAGQAVVVEGTVGDDVRVGGQAIVLGSGARVSGDLLVGGLSLESRPGSVVQGDLLVGAFQALLSGEIGQRVLGGLDRLELRGSVGGDVNVDVSGDPGTGPMVFSPAGQVPIPSVAPNLTVADSARIGGKLIYRSRAQANLQTGSQITGGVAFDQAQAATQPAMQPAALWLDYLRRLVSLVLVGLLMLWIAPAWTRRLADTVEQRPLPSLGWGALAFVAFLAALIGALILIIIVTGIFSSLTLGGLAGMVVGTGLVSIAALIIAYIGFSAYLAQGVVAYMAGRWLLRRALPAWAERPAAALAVGLILYVLLSAVPWLNTLVGIAVVLLALGALWQWGRSKLGRSRPTPAPVGGLQPA